jgi:serine/threonine protein kinase
MFTKPYGLRVNPKTTFKVSKLKSKFWRRFRTPFGIKPHNTCAIQTQIENDIVGGKGIQSQSEEVHEGKEATEDYKSVKRGTEHDRSLESHSDAPDLQVEAHLTLLPALAKRDVTSPNSRIGLILGTTLQLKEILGAGGNGVVYSAVDLNTSVTYAVKALSKCDANGDPLDDRAREFRVREIQLHYAASAHPNIVSLVWIIDQPDCTFLVMDYYPDGDLFTRITEKNSYLGDDMAIRTAFLQIIDAVEHCHKLGIYCRDLKPENILLNGSQLALIDFGMATTTPSSEDHGCGSSYYNSPGKYVPLSSREQANYDFS